MKSTSETDVIYVDDLHAWAKGDLRTMAALQLLDESNLIAHIWIDRFIKTDPWLHFDFDAMKRQIRRAPFSGAEQSIAEAALSLAGKLDVDLGSLALSLDQTNLTALLDAIAQASGKPEVR
ncbi:hypothetical protein [Glycomyces buryatensis]|uniref:Uncharacterized protein n=1 Tax=Glycomyces buryatensis TaxID=2570927 RepID=A0A4V4HS67_9ACTN|nr:hypothetical protein [Glycomyces buryatensis]THV40576.1 hypothetical protein FAB82_15020 [Glycomyces buryatensis]